MKRLASIFFVALALWCAPARADDPLVQARAHSEAGRALYTLGRYDEALREFNAGYALVANPRFLVNIGQCERALGHEEAARDTYRHFLRDAPADDPLRREVTGIVAELDAHIAAAPPPAPPAATPPPAPVVEVAAPPPPPRRSFIRRHWWIFPVGAAVLTGVAVGIYFGVRPAPALSCGSVALGCVDASHGP
jgi:tetratricopeptide (TPR) repeat protein